MKARPRYYTLIASLPRLEHFELAERLPISHLRLEQRLAMLEPDHSAQLARARTLVSWEHQPISRTDEEQVRRYREVVSPKTDPELREFIEYRLEQRTIVAAMRRRQLGLDVPPPGSAWGVGRWARDLPRRWDRLDFGLSAVHPWIPEALAHLQAGDAFALERLLLGDIWRTLDRLGDREPFGFAQVVSYFFRWDVLRRWLSYDAASAQDRFQVLLDEILETHELPRD